MNAPFGWPGGKKNLKLQLLKLIPKHRCYVEVFSGSAKLLFAKDPSQWEILNDWNSDLINFFRVAKYRAAELAQAFDIEIVHAERFLDWKGAHPTDEIHRAMRFAYLTWWSFGAKGEHFATTAIASLRSHARAVHKSIATVREILTKTATRLHDVQVERRDFADCIRRYDSPDTFFYCDPPYTSFGRNGRYETLAEDRHRELIRSLANVKGKFLLSYDDSELVREEARACGLKVRRIEVKYTLAKQAAKRRKFGELLVSNY
ncbi:MAG TPA: DNA adenine methylase [Terriglobales bacterium]|nr:DNA adenine methylase [Terriglobales bacterium]